MVPLVFFSNLLLWIVVFSFFSVFASPNGMTTLTSGSVAVFFHECLYRAVFYAPLALSITLMAVFFFLMRHKTIVWITALTVLALLVLCIFLVMPLSYRFLEDNTWTFLSNRSELAGMAGRVFSPNVIRPDGDSSRMVWYSVRDDGRKVAPLLVAGADKRAPFLPGIRKRSMMVYLAVLYPGIPWLFPVRPVRIRRFYRFLLHRRLSRSR